MSIEPSAYRKKGACGRRYLSVSQAEAAGLPSSDTSVSALAPAKLEVALGLVGLAPSCRGS
jgi:hypothetical protein